MRRHIEYTVLALSLIPLFISAAAMAEGYSSASSGGAYGSAFQKSTGNASTDKEIDYTQIIEDTDIMAKIIDDALEKRWPKKYEPSTLFRQSIGCQGIYLKGYGAVFMTNINFPVAERVVQQQEEPPTDDLWEQTRRELNSLPQAGAFSEGTFSYVAPGTEDYDAKRLGALKEELLRLIGEYGVNIRQLGPQESVIIVVRGMPGDALTVLTTGYYNDYEKPYDVALKTLGTNLKRNEEAIKQYREILNQDKEAVETLKKKIDKTPGLDGAINYELVTPSEVTVQVEDLNGITVRTIKQSEQEAGEKVYHWDGKDDQGKDVGAGIYNYEVQAGESKSTGKIMLTKQPKSGARRRAVSGNIPSPEPAVEAAVPEDAPSSLADPTLGAIAASEYVVEASPVVPAVVAVEMNEGGGTGDVITRVFRTTSSLASGKSVSGRTTLIVKVSRESIMQYKDGSLEFEDFANQAEVTQY